LKQSHNISIQLGSKKTKVKHFSLSQSVSDHHRFTVSCDAHALGDKTGIISADEAYDYLGHKVIIKVEDKNSKSETLEFHGTITQINLGKTNHDYDQVILTGKGNSIFVDEIRRQDTYSEMSIGDIAKEVLADAVELDIVNDPTPSYATQYRETSYDFISRLAFKYGLWFFYNGKKLILGDKPDIGQIDVRLGPHIEQMDLSLTIFPINFEYSFYHYEDDELYSFKGADVKAPDMDKFGQAAYDGSQGMYTSTGSQSSYELFDKESELKDFVTQRVHSRAAQMMGLYGNSDQPGIQIGTKINVKDASNNTVGSYYIIQIDHSCDGQGHYSNTFQAIPAALKSPPPNPNVRLPKASHQVGHVVDNADPDLLGRVRVQFHWQDDKKDEMTPWIRVIYPYAGAGDSYFCPEIDDQVMVGFEMNNPDRPFVMGSVYHGKNKPQYATDDNTVKAIHTKCGHRIIFEDGDESLISIYTKDDKNHIILDVADDGQISITTEGILKLKGKTINLEGDELNIKMDSAINIEAGQDVSLKGANVTVKADQAASLSGMEAKVSGDTSAEMTGAQVKVEGSAMAVLKGAMVNIN